MLTYLPGTRWLLPCRLVPPCRCGICVCRCAGTSSSSPQGIWHPPWLNGTAWWPSSFLLWLTSFSERREKLLQKLIRNILETVSVLLWLIQTTQSFHKTTSLVKSISTENWPFLKLINKNKTIRMFFLLPIYFVMKVCWPFYNTVGLVQLQTTETRVARDCKCQSYPQVNDNIY